MISGIIVSCLVSMTPSPETCFAVSSPEMFSNVGQCEYVTSIVVGEIEKTYPHLYVLYTGCIAIVEGEPA